MEIKIRKNTHKRIVSGWLNGKPFGPRFEGDGECALFSWGWGKEAPTEAFFQIEIADKASVEKISTLLRREFSERENHLENLLSLLHRSFDRALQEGLFDYLVEEVRNELGSIFYYRNNWVHCYGSVPDAPPLVIKVSEDSPRPLPPN